MRCIPYILLITLLGLTQQLFAATDSLRIDESKVQKLSYSELQQKYSDKSFDYVESNNINSVSWWQRFKMWLAQKIYELFQVSNPAKVLIVIEWILKIVGILLLIFVLYKILKIFLTEDGQWIFARKSESIPIEAHDLVEQILFTDFDKLIQDAIQSSQYRLAVRYYYWQVLQRLNQKNLIEWQFEKTNRDYYNELKNKDLKQQFQYISYVYDYAWYGEFDLTENEFRKGAQSFQHLLTQI